MDDATPKVRITVDGKLALTTRQAASEQNTDLATMRKRIQRVGCEPVAQLDDRTPLYGAVALRAALRDRPGKGRRKEARTK
jgi:hypothetical protein